MTEIKLSLGELSLLMVLSSMPSEKKTDLMLSTFLNNVLIRNKVSLEEYQQEGEDYFNSMKKR